MDFYLAYSNTELLRLPVPPPDFTIQQGNMNQSATVTNLGELNLWGPEKLATITLASFLPYTYNPTYCAYTDLRKPWDSIELINKWRLSGKPIRLIITDQGKDVDINLEMLIESLDSKMQDASGDIYFTLVLKEYKKAGTSKTSSAGSTTTVRSTPPSIAAPTSNNTQRFHTVVSGESLWTIAKKYYGVGSDYPKIVAANPGKIQDVSLIYAGQVFLIP